jgi:transmembrane sensor
MKEVNRTAILLFLSTRLELTKEEERELLAWRKQSGENEKLFRRVNDEAYIRSEIKKVYASRSRSFEKLKEHFPFMDRDEDFDMLFAEEFDNPESEIDGMEFGADGLEPGFSDPEVSKAAFWTDLLTGIDFPGEQLEETNRLAREWRDDHLPEIKEKTVKTGRFFKIAGRWVAGVISTVGLSLTVWTQIWSGIQPGGFKANLFSFDGIFHGFNDLNRGYALGEAGFDLRKDSIGKTIFLAPNYPNQPKDKFNVLTIPGGGEFPIQFADGTNMWINAGSRLQYPANFSGDTIRIRFEGEAYIEVPQNSRKVFEIYVNGRLLRTNGMRANIKAYPEDGIFYTTLLSGSASYTVDRDHDASLNGQLHSGEQIQFSGDILKIYPSPDMAEVMAWRNNRLMFHEENLSTIMHSISRWYNVKIEYKGIPTNKKYNLNVPRDGNISWLLFALEIRGVECKVDGKMITVTQSEQK